MMHISYFITLFLSICIGICLAQNRDGGMGGFIEDLLTNLFQERDIEDQREPFSGGRANSNRQKRFCTKYPEPGRCDGREIMFYFDPFAHQCRRFAYSGCGGNKNRFRSYAECNEVCNTGVIQDGFLQSDLPRGSVRSSRLSSLQSTPARTRGGDAGGFLSRNGDGGFGFDAKKLQGFGQLGIGFLRALRMPGPYRGSFGVCTPETCPEFYENVDKFKDNLDDRLLDIETAGEISKKEGGTEFLKEVFQNRKNNRNNNGRGAQPSRPLTSKQATANRRTDDYYDTYDP